MKIFLGIALALSLISLSAQAMGPKRIQSDATPIKVSFILTNDIHGHLEPSAPRNGKQTGGMAYLASIIHDIRGQAEYVNEQAALFLLDSGDQFQGTLLSNYDEGQTIFKAFNKIGYDAAVPGNHDYDFGPIGWLYDKVIPGKTSDNPMEVIEKLASMAKFPLLSANTYYKSSITQSNGAPVELDSQCLPKNLTLKDPLDFSHSTRPDFLQPYTIIERAGVRVALIGIDNHATASMTTIENVNALCFRDEVETYLEIRKNLEGKADVFVLMMHNGNSDNASDASDITQKINAQYPNAVHLVAAAHTHFVHNNNIGGVYVQQNGSGSQFFGRVDLFFDPLTHTVLTDQTQSFAGISIDPTLCDSTKYPGVCAQYSLPVAPSANIQKLIDHSNKVIGPIANRVLAHAEETITRDRISENALGNILTDALRKAANTEISMINSGGIRENLAAGDVLYKNLFEVLPFNNIGVKMNAVPWGILRSVLQKSIQSCGAYGAMDESGLLIQYHRTCLPQKEIDPTASLIHVETLAGEVLFDQGKNLIADTRTFSLATLDFLASGGSDYSDLASATVNSEVGIAREVIADAMAMNPPILTSAVDGRMKNIATPAPQNKKAE
jgi:2',3'-cyclic-nucleotide 2'-phosphodiesterase (5'-nucleotidase family)